jgi:hypothetical protein
MKDLEIEILEILSMSPEPFDMLVEMIELEDGTSPSPEQVHYSLMELQEDGLVQANEGLGTDREGNLEGYVWLSLTDEGRAVARTLG